MATYKVPQNVEAEDKLIGPFSPKQFIFLIIAAISTYLTVALWGVSPFLIILTLPLALVFGALGLIRRDDQPIEIYLVAVLRFLLKPHRRIWSRDGVLETVIVTAPKREEKRYSDGLNTNQVRSRLSNLAQTMDTRGWASKNQLVQEAAGVNPVQQGDRLFMPQYNQEPVDVHQVDDLFDPNNQLARDLAQRTQAQQQAAQQQAVQQMNDPQYNPYPSTMRQNVVQPQSQSSATASGTTNTSTMTEQQAADILRLSQNNDLSVSGLARQAEQAQVPQNPNLQAQQPIRPLPNQQQ